MKKDEGYSVKREIKGAVIQLMAEKTYMDITVVDIVNCAGVARASFYRNFNSINYVIDAIAEEMSEELVEDIYPIIHNSNDRKWREFLFDHFYHLKRRQKQISNLRSENASTLFSRINEKMQRTESATFGETEWERYLAEGKLGLINSISKRWVDTGMKSVLTVLLVVS